MLAEYTTETASNYNAVTKKLLNRIDTKAQNKASYKHNEYERTDMKSHTFVSFIYHCLTDDGLVFLALATAAFDQRHAFAYLNDIKNRFREKYADSRSNAKEGEMTDGFGPIMKKQAVPQISNSSYH